MSRTAFVPSYRATNASRANVGDWRAPRLTLGTPVSQLTYSAIGMILYSEGKEGIKYALVRRRASYGLHRILAANIGDRTCFKEISNAERAALLEICEMQEGYEETFRTLWQDAWWGDKAVDESFIKRSFARFMEMRSVIGNCILTTPSIFPNGVWGFPKGKNDKNQNEVMCALREVREETGLASSHVSIQPFDTVIETYKMWNYKYFTAKVDSKNAVDRFMPKDHNVDTEVSHVVWLPFEEAIRLIPEDMEEKKNLLTSLNSKLIAMKK